MGHRLFSLILMSLALAGVGCVEPQEVGERPPGSLASRDMSVLRVATWNLEHLAEENGSGCRPRQDSDYDALRTFANELDVDVIAFQEVESAKAAARVFDPIKYAIVIEDRPGTPSSKPPCNGAPQLRLNRQATGFAIRRSLAFERSSDLTTLQDGDANLRSGVDITVTSARGAPFRLLSVHLKSGCAGGSTGAACEALKRQVQALDVWTEGRAAERTPFAILGDFNRRLALPNDQIWQSINGAPGPDLALAAGATTPSCNPRYNAFIDHVVLDRSIVANGFTFEEITYSGDRLSDHCPVVVSLQQ